jgi:dienelactone hydrolase
MKKRICWGLLTCAILLNLYCVSTNRQTVIFYFNQASSRVFDLKTRGEDTETLAQELDRCRALLQAEEYSKAEECVNAFIQRVNQRYLKDFPLEYVYDGVRFHDVTIRTSFGEKTGFIASPLSQEKHPGIIFLRGAWYSAIDYKRMIFDYAKKNYVCLVPEFDSAEPMKGVIDLNEWIRVFNSYPQLDPQRVAIISFSRGSLFAFRLIKNNVSCQAWVNYFGAVHPSLVEIEDIQKNPIPVLILHGKKDKTCPVKWAYNLENVYKKAGISCEIKIFEDEGHGFSQEANEEAKEIVDKFLTKHLLQENQQPSNCRIRYH